MKDVFQVLKFIALIVIVIGFLKITGLKSTVNSSVQKLALNTGFLNVNPKVGKTRPDFDYNFNIKDLSGNTIPFSTYKGKVVFINIWATWCGPCRAEMPGIQSLSEKLNNQAVEFVMLSQDRPADLPKVRSYLDKYQFTFPVYLPHGNLPEQVRVPSIPTTFVIGKDGKVLLKEVGTRNYDTKKMMNFLIEQSKL